MHKDNAWLGWSAGEQFHENANCAPRKHTATVIAPATFPSTTMPSTLPTQSITFPGPRTTIAWYAPPALNTAEAAQPAHAD